LMPGKNIAPNAPESGRPATFGATKLNTGLARVPCGARICATFVGEPAGGVVADGGVLVTTRPTPPVDPARGVRQEIVMVRLDRPALRSLVEAVATGGLRTRVAAVAPLTEAAEAHRRFEAGGLRGKLVLIP